MFESFTGHDAEQVDTVSLPDYDTAACVGKCTLIGYETVRDGEHEFYIHEFRESSRPLLCITHDGQQILLIGGSYLFKETGINDV